MELTPRNLDVLSAIHELEQDTGWDPTIREIAQHLEMGSTATVHRHIDKLVALGLVERKGTARRITLLGRSALRGRVAA